jgi:ActR/RegA family two-component response regulator
MTDKDATQKASKESVRPLEGRRVLVVEDDSDTRQRLKFILEQNGADVVSTESVPAALEQIRIAPPRSDPRRHRHA